MSRFGDDRPVFSSSGPLNLPIEVCFLSSFLFGFKDYHFGQEQTLHIQTSFRFVSWVQNHTVIIVTESFRGLTDLGSVRLTNVLGLHFPYLV